VRRLLLGFAALALCPLQVGAQTVSQLVSKKCVVVGVLSGTADKGLSDGDGLRDAQFLIFQCPEFRVYSCQTSIAESAENSSQLGVQTFECLQVKNME
jgi:hypothetical protein